MADTSGMKPLYDRPIIGYQSMGDGGNPIYGEEQLVGYAKETGNNTYQIFKPDGTFSHNYSVDPYESLKGIGTVLAAPFIVGGAQNMLGGAGSTGVGNGAFLGEGVASGVPTWDAAALSAGNTLSGASPALLDAQFIAADAAQLAAQTGNNVAAIQQNLIAAGVDPIVAATAADAAAMGVSGSQLINTIASAGSSGAGLFTGGSAADLALGGISTVAGAPAGSTIPGATGAAGAGSGLGNALSNALSNPSLLSGLLGAALSGAGNNGGGGGGGTSTPTQGIPQMTPEYFQAVQNYYNAYLPGTNPNVGSYLSDWYSGKFTG